MLDRQCLHAGRVGCDGDNQFHAGVFGDHRDAVIGKGGGERHERRTRLHHGENGDVGLGGAVEQKSGPAARPQPPADQHAGEAIGMLIQFAVCPDAILRNHGGRRIE